MDTRRAIVELLHRDGPMPLYRLARRLGLPYGTVQWYVFTLEREGLVETIKVGRRRYVGLKTKDFMDGVKVGDILQDFLLTLSTYGVRPGMSLREALKVLEGRAPHVAELLRMMLRKA